MNTCYACLGGFINSGALLVELCDCVLRREAKLPMPRVQTGVAHNGSALARNAAHDTWVTWDTPT